MKINSYQPKGTLKMKSKHLILLAVLAFAGGQPEAKAQLLIDLRSAENFAVLAGSGITVAGAVNSTTITGDIGTFPTPSITGLGSVVLNGVNHAGDAFTQNAKNDLLAAYNDAVGRSATTTYGAIFDLGGLTLAPGVHKDPTSFAITGNLRLDAQGNPNAVWIFQAGTTLITAGSSQVILINGAQANNVFWQVGSSATLGGSSVLQGNVLANASIGLGAGATVDGRLLAQDGAVTLGGNNVITAIPEPAGMSMLIAGFLGLLIGVRRIRRHYSDSKLDLRG